MRSGRTSLFRALSVLALAALAVVVVAGVSPGATRYLTKAQAKNLFYTKPQSDNRFVNVEELTVEAWRHVGPWGGPGDPEFGTAPGLCQVVCWTSLGSVHNYVGFHKDPFGMVHLKGVASCVANAPPAECPPAGDPRSVIFTLPAGYRPAAQEAVSVLSSVAGNIARIDVTSSGQVVLRGPMLDYSDWVSLDGISFRAA